MPGYGATHARAGAAGGATAHGVAAVLLDFFGTLVSYSPSRTEQGYHATHALVRSVGARVGYAGLLRAWADESARFDARSEVDDSEFSMREVSASVLSRLLHRDPTPAEVAALVRSYLAEWNAAVTYPPDVRSLLEPLAGRFRLAVVTNTHEPGLVPDHLTAMGIADLVTTVVTSVELGWRKPHPAVYGEALRRLGVRAAAAVFVGDSLVADYLGPRAAGVRALLLDPHARHDVPEAHRLHSLADLPGRLGAPLSPPGRQYRDGHARRGRGRGVRP